MVALPWTRWYGGGATLDDDEADCLFLLIVASCSVFSLRGRLRDSDGSDAVAFFFLEEAFPAHITHGFRTSRFILPR